METENFLFYSVMLEIKADSNIGYAIYHNYIKAINQKSMYIGKKERESYGMKC